VPRAGLVASESVVERRDHVDEPSPLQGIASKFVLDASNAMHFVTAEARCERGPADVCPLVEQFDLAVQLVMEVLRLAAVSVQRRYSLAGVGMTAHQTTLTRSLDSVRFV
jgi:hypothetical protein